MQDKIRCCFCGKEIDWMTSNDPRPIRTEHKDARCCDSCNASIVIPTRLAIWGRKLAFGDIKHLLDDDCLVVLVKDPQDRVLSDNWVCFKSGVCIQKFGDDVKVFEVDDFPIVRISSTPDEPVEVWLLDENDKYTSELERQYDSRN